jgi:hypothetical protein
MRADATGIRAHQRRGRESSRGTNPMKSVTAILVAAVLLFAPAVRLTDRVLFS